MGQNNESQALTPFLREEEKKKTVVALPPLALQSSVFSPETLDGVGPVDNRPSTD